MGSHHEFLPLVKSTPPDQRCVTRVLVVQVKHKKFDDIKADIAARWSALPPAAEVISAPLRRKIAANMAAMEKCQVTQNRSSPRQAAQ